MVKVVTFLIKFSFPTEMIYILVHFHTLWNKVLGYERRTDVYCDLCSPLWLRAGVVYNIDYVD